MRSVVRIKHSMERLASHGGLVHIGALLHSMQLEKRLENLENVYCVDPKFSHTDVLFSMIALISIGKSDYDAIKIFREKQDFFIKALGISGCPSSPTIRQRIDLIGNAADDILKEESAALIRSKAPVITPIKTSVGLKGEQLPFPIFFEVTERHMKKGQQLMFPDIEVDTYWCSLEQLDAEEVISLYQDHGTSEQYHSEIKSDMGLERLPSCHFSSNSLVLLLGMSTYNMLRIIGQISLEEAKKDQLPRTRRKKVTRRRIRTVMQDLVYMAVRLIHTGRRWFISFGRLNPFAGLFERIFNRIRARPAPA